MSALAVSREPERSWDELVRFWEEMEWPEGSKVEIIEGIVTMSPSPAVRHNLIASLIHRQLLAVVPDDWEIFQTQAVAVPSRLGMFGPDILVVPPLSKADEEASHLPAGMAELVVEITSQSSAGHDHVKKPAAYAAGGVPLYLLVDRWSADGPTITLYGRPSKKAYRVLWTGQFGQEVPLPEPFNCKLDTSQFPVG
jgi:Uma2 family endonuclease